jgi:TP901 family phage tail tape measure protein
MGSEIFKLGAVLTFREMMSGGVKSLTSHWDKLKKTIGETDPIIRKAENSVGAMKFGTKIAAGVLALTLSMGAARMETSKLEGNLKSLGVSSQEVNKLSYSASAAAAEFGIAKDVYLTGAYDIKSAVSSLNSGQMEQFAHSIALAATATKGDFAQMSKLFGMVYNQFGAMSGLDPGAFAEKAANTFAFAVKQFRTDGAALDQAFNSAGMSAARMGVTIGEQTAVLGTLMNTMQPGEAGTAWKAYFGHLESGFSKLKLEARKDGKLLGVADQIEEIQKRFNIKLPTEQLDALNKLDPAQRSGAVKALINEKTVEKLNSAFGEEGAKMVYSLIGVTNELRTSVEGANKASTDAAEMSSANLNNLGGQWAKLKGGLGGFWDNISKGMDGPFIKVFGGLNSLLEKYNKLSGSTKDLISHSIGLALVLGGIAGTVIAVGGALSFYRFMKLASAKAALLEAEAEGVGAVVKQSWLRSAVASIGMTIKDTAVKGYNAVASWVAAGAEKDLAFGKSVLNRLANLGFVVQMREGGAKMLNAARTKAAAAAEWGLGAVKKAGIALSNLSAVATVREAVVKRGAMAATKAMAAGQWLLNAAMYASPIVLIVGGILLLGAAVYGVVKHWKDFVEWADRAWTSVKNF